MGKRFIAGCCVAVVIAQTGCLTLYSKTEVVRGDEARRPIQFESPQTAECFQTAMNQQSGIVGGTCLGVPFVTLYAKHQRLSKNAQWNDLVSRCDTDQNGIITSDEVAVFSKSTGSTGE